MGREGPSPWSLAEPALLHLRVKNSSAINSICCEGCQQGQYSFYIEIFSNKFSNSKEQSDDIVQLAELLANMYQILGSVPSAA